MKKKQLIILITSIVLILLIIGIIIYCVFKGKKTEPTEYVGSIKTVDFSIYESKDVVGIQKINQDGVYVLKDKYEGTITVDARKDNVKLVLNNAEIVSKEGPAIDIEDASVVYIELIGENTIKSTTTELLNAAIYSKSDIKFVGDGKLTITSNYDGIQSKDDLEIESGTYIINSGDDGISGKDSVVIRDGNFEINSTGDAIKTSNETEKGTMNLINGTFNINTKGDGITSIASLTIDGGTYNITTGKGSTASYSTVSLKAIKSVKDMKITGGDFKISSQDDSIHSNGSINIDGGSFDISSGDDGLHADKNLNINNGKINITKSYEGLEGLNITVNGGDVSIIATDDGFNAAGGDGSSYGRPGSANYSSNKEVSNVTITGGSIYVNSTGDGIDSNGNIIITGGSTYVDGPTSNGNGPMDYGDGGSYKFEVTGGELIAVGSAGMAVSPTNATVTSVLINTSNAYNGTITFGDINYSPKKAYNSILICSNRLNQGNTYTLKINDAEIQSLQLNNVITTSGTTGNHGGPGGGDHGGGSRRGW